MPDWQIAQINLATGRYALDDPRMADFVASLDAVNALADGSPGFVWRLQSESGNATDIQVDENPNVIVNMSLWQSVEALFDFVYTSAHRDVMVRRRDWFLAPLNSYQVLWWVRSGELPTVEQGLARLRRLNEHGPTPDAFTFKAKFPPPDTIGGPQDMQPEPFCAAWR